MMMKSVFWWRKPEHPEETTDLRQVTDETFSHIRREEEEQISCAEETIPSTEEEEQISCAEETIPSSEEEEQISCAEETIPSSGAGEEDSDAEINFTNGEEETDRDCNGDDTEVVPKEDAGKDSVHRLPRSFSFQLSAKTWEKCKPTTSKGDHYNVLQPGWTDIFYNHVARFCDCVVTFQGRVWKEASRKSKSSPYFRATAPCKFTGCGVYHMTIQSEPLPGKSVSVNVVRDGPDNIQQTRYYSQEAPEKNKTQVCWYRGAENRSYQHVL